MSSPTAKALDALRRDGWTVQVVERWLPHANIRQDFLGFADILAIRPGSPVLAVQATSGSNHSSRVKKALALATLRTWLSCGCAFEVHSWQKDTGGKWTCRKTAVVLNDLDGISTEETPRPRRRHRKPERTLFDDAPQQMTT